MCVQIPHRPQIRWPAPVAGQGDQGGVPGDWWTQTAGRGLHGPWRSGAGTAGRAYRRSARCKVSGPGDADRGVDAVNAWLLFALVILISLFLAVGIILLANRLLPSSIGKEHNSALSPFLTTVALVYGALLGFTVVVAW